MRFIRYILSSDKLTLENQVTQSWVYGHKGIGGNENADRLVKKGSETIFPGPQPNIGITKNSIKGKIWE